MHDDSPREERESTKGRRRLLALGPLGFPSSFPSSCWSFLNEEISKRAGVEVEGGGRRVEEDCERDRDDVLMHGIAYNLFVAPPVAAEAVDVMRVVFAQCLASSLAFSSPSSLRGVHRPLRFQDELSDIYRLAAAAAGEGGESGK